MSNNQTENVKSLTYRTVDGKDLFISFLPPLNKVYDKSPVFLLIPGGGWHTADQVGMLEFMRASVRKLRENGFLAASISYRTIDEGYKLHEIIEDCFFALKYLCDNSDLLNIDIKRIIVSGHSAGGHLALMLAYAGSNVFNVDIAKDYRIIGVAALSPITVLHNYKYEYSDLAKIDTYPLFNDKSEASPERRMTSPINYINEKTPPTILFAGTADTLVKCNSSVVLHEELNEYGVSSKLVLSKGGGHCFEKVNDNDNVSVSFDKVQELTAEFAMGVLTDSNKVFD